MAATTTTINSGAFNTIQERVSFQKEIKKSKFIAIAGPISDDNSAMSFLSQVRDPKATHNCWAYKMVREQQNQLQSLATHHNFLKDRFKLQHEMKGFLLFEEKKRLLETAKSNMVLGYKHKEASVL